METNYMEAAFAPAEAKYKQAVMRDCWGHLAPHRNKKYNGRVVYAVGCFGSDSINPTVLTSEFGDLDSSPWLYDALHEFLYENAPHGDENAGKVYEWIGAVRNYKFKGKFRLLLNTNN